MIRGKLGKIQADKCEEGAGSLRENVQRIMES